MRVVPGGIDISIVVVTYNQADYIRQCLESVLSQETTFRFEILVGEDGSSDGTAEIVDELAAQYPDRIKAFHRSRSDVICVKGNPTNRFNLVQTLAQASGRYLAILDGDDYYTDKTKLQSQAQFLSENPDFSACYHDFVMVDAAGKSAGRKSRLSPREIVTAADIAVGRNLPASTFLSRNDFGPPPPWFMRMAYADWALLLLRIGGGKIGYLDRVMSAYRIHAASLFSTTSNLKRLQGERSSAALFRRHWQDRRLARAAGDREFRCLVRLAREYHRSARLGASRMALRLAAGLFFQGACHRTMKNARRLAAESVLQLLMPWPVVNGGRRARAAQARLHPGPTA